MGILHFSTTDGISDNVGEVTGKVKSILAEGVTCNEDRAERLRQIRERFRSLKERGLIKTRRPVIMTSLDFQKIYEQTNK